MVECEICGELAELYDPMGNRLCSGCIQTDVDEGEYTWDECETL